LRSSLSKLLSKRLLTLHQCITMIKNLGFSLLIFLSIVVPVTLSLLMVTICIPSQLTKLKDQNVIDILFVGYHVHITNDFVNQSIAPPVHCKFWGGEDLDLHISKQHDQYWGSFKIDVLRRTCYTCLVKQSLVIIAQHIHFASKNFTTFKVGRDESGCLLNALLLSAY